MAEASILAPWSPLNASFCLPAVPLPWPLCRPACIFTNYRAAVDVLLLWAREHSHAVTPFSVGVLVHVEVESPMRTTCLAL